MSAVPSGLPPALFLMGPTASGKTDLAVELVRRFPFEIVSVDSALVYRGMDIGTAKPGAEILREAPHRLIDFLDPRECYSAARFQRDALSEMAAISRAGRVPLLVGGTMLYFRVLDQGMSELPGADVVVRARLNEVRVTQGPEALYRRLQAVDPESASRIHPNDPQRLQRALEVYEVTGRSLTEWHLRQRPERCPYRVLKLVVTPAERMTLHRRIEVRFHRMLEQGFVVEVRHLRARGDLGPNNVSMRAVGYRQVWDYLDGVTDYATMVQRGLAATRQLAKRQLTWLRSEPRTVWLDSLAPGLMEQAIARINEARFFPE